MKFFRRKKSRQAEAVSRPVTPPVVPDESFYTRPSEAPLNSRGISGAVPRTAQKTSQHSPAKRRENSNRTSNRAMAWLLIRAMLIVLLLVGGFLGLRALLNHLSEPSEKEMLQWDARAALMEQGGSVSEASSETWTLTAEEMAARLEQWTVAARHFRAGEAYARRGINQDAIERLREALRLVPDYRAAKTLLLDVYLDSGMYSEAVPLCLRLLDQDSGRWDVQMKLLEALQKGGQTDSGLVLADHMLTTQPNNTKVLETAAAFRLAQNDQEQALSLLLRLLDQDGKNVMALKGVTFIYASQQSWQEALPYYLELIRLAPDSDVYQALALCYAQVNEESKAVVSLGQAASLYGEKTVSPWLRNPGFDPVRETVEFRSFADHIVGVETREAIEDIRRREADQTTPQLPGGLELPSTKPDLQLLRPGQ
jgi:tetratricopeptide (TPR) repeat protein